MTRRSGRPAYADRASENGPITSRLRELTDDHGVKLRVFPEDLVMAARRQAGDILGEVGKRDAIAGKVLASYSAFRQRNAPWSRVSIEAVLRARGS